MGYEATSEKVKHLAHTVTDGERDADRMLRRETLQVSVTPVAVAGTASNHTLAVIPAHHAAVTLISASLTFEADVVEDDTDYITLSLLGGTAGAMSALMTAVTTKVTGGIDISADVPLALTLTTTALVAGNVIELGVAKAASGKVLPNGVFTLVYDVN
jgi:hypothetical protein